MQDLNKITNSQFQGYYFQLQQFNNVDMKYFKTVANFIINNKYIMHNSKIYYEKSEIPQGGCSSITLADLLLYNYEKNFKVIIFIHKDM